MNEVAMIDEIAKQLGMATDQVSGHIAELWPMYVEAMQVYKMSMGFGSLVVLVLCLIGFTLALKKADKDDFDTTLPIFYLVICGVIGVVALTVSLFSLPEAIAFLVNPDGATMSTLINSLKG